ncbi:MAG TPA: PA14 domain-containing protein [Herpetosiphonaceae bacterium]
MKTTPRPSSGSCGRVLPNPTQIIPQSQLLPAPGVVGTYYQNPDFTSPVGTRQDPTVNFDWGYGSPDAAIESSTFSVRWLGQVVPRFNETYTFYTQNDDGVRLWVNDPLLIDDWHDHGLTEHQGMPTMKTTAKPL